ncbi:hypothetical protein BVG79_02160 [Ketogulonicigenium robustum]|uniref:Uncharacterized protein n=1 Tax=Ketogulonicigenium robustum TaxID=92947 RepID=A0A1W6P2D8_9RHOB|nr:hypothetical protein [Ketogulonicigenium robustum]ARO15500.1 hypothetical protein BVG79_02160 [Ketogulonicigenium robustum]
MCGCKPSSTSRRRGGHSYPTTGLGQGPGTQTGNVTAIATYPDGTLAILSNDRLVRAELVAD